MASESKSFVFASQSIPEPAVRAKPASDLRSLIEVAFVYGLILFAVWTPQGQLNRTVSLAALIATIVLTGLSQYSVRDLGISQPLKSAGVMIGFGTLLVLMIIILGLMTRSLGPPQPLPLHRAWQYAIWALLQEFLLQSFLYLRLESLFGRRPAVIIAAGLFALAHIPSPLLTILSFLGGLFFCEMFCRYRNIFPLGVLHAALGLTIASIFPDHILHHMRVGLGYLMYHV